MLASEAPWAETARNWVYGNLLKKAGFSTETRTKYVDRHRVGYWYRALTNETADESEDNTMNYEKDETFGDAGLKFLAINFFRQKLPNATVAVLTEITSQYSSGSE